MNTHPTTDPSTHRATEAPTARPDATGANTVSDLDFVLALVAASDHVQRQFDRALSNVKGISFGEYQLLRAIHMSSQSMATRVELSKLVGLSPSGVTRALKPLEKLGIVETERADRDARRAIAVLTPAGQTLVADASVVVDDVIADLKPLRDLDKSRRSQAQSLLLALADR